MEADIRKSGLDQSTQPNSRDLGYSINPGPYVAIVMGHVEGSRSGRLKIYIPESGKPFPNMSEVGAFKGDFIDVAYASPFFGVTAGANDGGIPPSSSIFAPQSYGMWCVPPDIGNRVLVTFPNGDRDDGYWFACVYNTPDHHMVPGNARHIGGAGKVKIDKSLATKKYFNTSSILPAAESPISDILTFDPDGLQNVPRWVHLSGAMTLVAQGLDTDPIRGAISSSSLRESPSNVYGISTPGRKLTPSDQDPRSSEIVYVRKGGHSFVMDDGSVDGTDQLIRLRTTGGHQVLMNDTEKILYIASSTGNQWLEFSAAGSINVYGAGGINMRSEGPINLHSDSAINMNAPNIGLSATMGVKIESLLNVSVNAGGFASVKALGMLTLSAGGIAKLTAAGLLNIGATGVVSIDGAKLLLNCAKPSLPLPSIPTIPKSHDKATWTGTNWNPKGGSTLSICTVVPGHEPWVRPVAKK